MKPESAIEILGDFWAFAGAVFSVLCIVWAIIPERSPLAKAWQVVLALAGFSLLVSVLALIIAVVVLPR